jgi:GAF domain-containing protein
MSQTRFTVATALAEAARTIHDSHSLQETLDAIVHAARTSVPGFDHVGISTVDRSGSVETKAATGDLVFELDDLQYTLREGPCMDSLSGERVVVVDDARHEQRWPRYIPEALRHGLHSQLAFRLHHDGRTLGGLNLYSTESDRVSADAAQLAELFAAHATIALDRAIEHDTLVSALETRSLIGQALGLTMAQYQVDSERAFHFLSRVSSSSNTKIRDIAREIVEQADERYAGGRPDPTHDGHRRNG